MAEEAAGCDLRGDGESVREICVEGSERARHPGGHWLSYEFSPIYGAIPDGWSATGGHGLFAEISPARGLHPHPVPRSSGQVGGRGISQRLSAGPWRGYGALSSGETLRSTPCKMGSKSRCSRRGDGRAGSSGEELRPSNQSLRANATGCARHAVRGGGRRPAARKISGETPVGKFHRCPTRRRLGEALRLGGCAAFSQ